MSKEMTQEPAQQKPPLTKRIKAFVLKNFLPLSFLLALIVAFAWPLPGSKMKDWKVGDYGIPQTFFVCLIFLISGLQLKTDDIKKAFKTWPAFLYGAVSILIITASVGFIINEIPLKKDFRTGFIVFCVVPTTISSGVSLVGQAKGNQALALLLTVSTNLLGVFTSPFALQLILSGEQSITLEPVPLLVKLLITVLLPLLVGYFIRQIFGVVRKFMTSYKVIIGLVSNGALALIVFMTLSKNRDELFDQKFTQILLVLVISIVLHIAFMLINAPFTYFMPQKVVGYKEKIAVFIMASQKTLPISLSIIGFLGEVGVEALITIPCILSHLSQLFIDAFIAGKVAAKVTQWESEDANQPPPADEAVAEIDTVEHKVQSDSKV